MFKQMMLVTLEINKEIDLSTVVHWMNEKVSGSKIIEVRIQNTDLIFYGALNTFLGEMTILLTEAVNIDELTHLFRPYPYFIHQLKFKIIS